LILGLCQLHQQSKPSLFTTSILMKKLWSDSKNLMKKMKKLHHFLKNRNQIETKKDWRTTLLFLNENKNQRVIPKFLYKLVKTLYLIFL